MKGIDDEVKEDNEKETHDSHVYSPKTHEVMERDEDDYEAIVKGEQMDVTNDTTGSYFDSLI